MISIEKSSKKIFKLLSVAISGLIALIVLALVLLLIFDPYFFYIDSCLDAGGRWDEIAHRCEMAQTGTLLYPYACTTGGGQWDYSLEECKILSQE